MDTSSLSSLTYCFISKSEALSFAAAKANDGVRLAAKQPDTNLRRVVICNSPFVVEEVALDENFRFSVVRGALRVNSYPLIINMLLNVNPLLRALGGFDVQE